MGYGSRSGRYSQNQKMIEAIDLSKEYNNGIKAVSKASFKLAEGETLALVGTSGCGKSTTLKMLNRLIEPSSGRVIIAGEDTRSLKPEQLRRSIGYAIQNTGLFPHYTVAENVAVVPRLLQWKEKRIKRRNEELLEMVGLPAKKFARRYPHELSGGQQQRVGLARALAADPPLILLDEPFGALDRITRQKIQQEFKQLESLLQKTIVLVTHDVFEAVTLSDRLCVMDRGIVQQIGTPKELIFQSKNDFVREFFGRDRFQLELYVTRLKDLLPWLSSEPTNTRPIKKYDEDRHLLTVLEEIEFTATETSAIAIEVSGDRLVINTNCQELLTAFYRFKEAAMRS